ncbi:ABC transporter ATP-binding protein [Amycolatopsis sp. YIM 10]|uniref:ABC transporter ATP-binding protein n=1 Tax=Amycolatopsis sp. YIM 10 TaxID=2653857 RepID=UPI0012AA6460|nr:ABC transporter ATP-binding protein [Amycolatopsis sp. YIM 10]QFU87649.1 Taurine import ATP-binding protein TauB [Amycolatopsis sp. YIM 10]
MADDNAHSSRGPAVALEAVTIAYPAATGTYTAVSEVDLTVGGGRFVAIVGPTGCGKSTVLNAVAGLRAPSAGRVLVDGEPLRGLNRRAGYLFQQDALLPWKTVLDNVAFGLELKGIGKRERLERARDWVRRVGLAGFENSYPHQLSGGMRKRTAVAQTWIGDPELLLMDEPFGALDVQTRQVMENELLGLWTGSGKTVLFVTHDLDEAISLADEVVLLSAGPSSRVVGRYPVDLPRPRDLLDIRTEPEFTEIYRAIWADLRDEVMATYDRDVNRTKA